MGFNQNKNTYRQMDIVNYYSNDILYEPEKQILAIIQDELHGSRVLDIGVGAGRTTPYFSKLTKSYLGIDYSAEMIKRCKERFETNGTISFRVVDAINLDSLGSNCFDIVIFSYNG